LTAYIANHGGTVNDYEGPITSEKDGYGRAFSVSMDIGEDPTSTGDYTCGRKAAWIRQSTVQQKNPAQEIAIKSNISGGGRVQEP